MSATPWTEKELMAALRAAGWKRAPGPARVYRSPEQMEFHLDAYRPESGMVAWRYYAARRELPEGRPPWQLRLRERMREGIDGE